jgi:hypothetical protein
MGSVRTFRRKDLQGVRIRPVTGCARSLLFYSTTQTHVQVRRILHAARDYPPMFHCVVSLEPVPVFGLRGRQP